MKADMYKNPIKHNDIIVLGTDGLWDNLFDKDVKDCFKSLLAENGELADPKAASERIANLAKEMAHQRLHSTFFFARNENQKF